MRPILALSLLCAAALAEDAFVPAPYGAQKVEGYLGRRLQINLEGRLLRVDEERLLRGFENRPGEQDWIGEHAGKYLDAAANTWELTRDARLKEQMDRIAARLMAAQLPDGYLGTYLEKDRWTSWDVWVHKYDLLGLLAYHRATRSEPALAAARRIGDLLLATFGEGKRDIIASSTHVGMAATSVLEPVVLLHRVTQDKRYLDFAEYLVRSWEQSNGPKLLSSLESVGRVDQTANGKAYEMMSCLVGLVELHRATGNPRYRRVAELAWADIAARRTFLTGTVSNHEHFQPDGHFPGEESNEVGEGCATVTWLQFTWQLLRLTGEPAYARELERTVFNQLLAAQDPSDGNICYFTPLNGRKRPTPGVNCCVSSEPRGISMIPALAWGTLRGSPAILLYTSGVWRAPEADIQVLTGFPDEGDASILVTPHTDKPFTLLLRVPEWTRKFEAKVGAEKWTGKPGEFLEIRRAWKADEPLSVSMEMTIRVQEGAPSYPNHVAFVRGPQVLALDRDLTPRDSVPYLWRTAVSDPRKDDLVVADTEFGLRGVALNAKGRVERAWLHLLPFADTREYRIWIPRATDVSRAPVARTAFGRESASSRSAEFDGSICDERSGTWRATRAAQTQPDHWFAVAMEQPAKVGRIVFQHGAFPGGDGAFDKPPRVQVRRADGQDWLNIDDLRAYAASESGRYELKLNEPLEVIAVRVLGRPARTFITCAELAAYEK